MVQVIAHRGTGKGQRENTLQAFKTAISWDVDCIECDIRNSRDGVAVIIHDSSLDRFSSATGKVADYSLSELKAIDIGKGERIPTLTEFFDLVAPKKDVGIDLDVKVIGMEAQIMDRLQEYDLVHRTMISSFIQPVLKEVRSLNEDIVTALLYEYDLRNPVEVAKGLECTAINPQLHFIDSALIAKCHREGLKINPWVINEPEEMRRFIEYGVDGIITDLPLRLLKMRNRGS